MGRFISLFPIFLAFAAGGCGSNKVATQRPTKLFEGRTVRVACPGEPSAGVVKQYSGSWCFETGAQIQVVHYDPKQGPEAGPAADLWIISPARMPHWAAAGKLHEVPQSLTAADSLFAWEEILRDWRKLLTWDRKAYALPLLGDALLCFYRQDLFEDALEREQFRTAQGSQLPAPGSGPQTWEEYSAIAEHFNKKKRPGIDHPCASLPPLPAGDDELDREFYSVVVPFAHRAIREDDPKPPSDDEALSFHYDLKTGAARISAPGFVKGLQILQRLQACRPVGASAEPAESFQKGEAVLCLATPSWIDRFQKESRLQGKIGICRPPGSAVVFDFQNGAERTVRGGNFVPYLGAGGWLAVVPRTNDAPEAALALARALADPEISRQIVIEPKWGGGVFRRTHLEVTAGWQSFGLENRTETLLRILREILVHPQVKNPVTRLRIPDEREHQAALLAEVRQALLHGKGPAKALGDALKRWQELDRKRGKATRPEYRLSIGLSGDF